jgi:hypothetical protein
MSIEEKYELFESMMDKSLSAEEKILVDSLMRSQEFKAEYDEYCALQNQFMTMQKNEINEEDFISNLKKISSEHGSSTSNEMASEKLAQSGSTKLTLIRNLKWLLSAAAILLIGFFGYQQFFTPQQSMQQLYASNFSIEPLSMERGTGDDSLETILKLYNNKQYQEALPLLKLYNGAHLENNNTKLAEAICLFQTDNYVQSETVLNAIITENNTYKEKAQWYLALNYLKQEKKAKIITLLKSFDTEHFYSDKAKAILKNLE